MSSDLPPPNIKSEIRQLLEDHWSELTQRAARYTVRQIIWTRRLDRATLFVVAATLFLMVQIGIKLACLAELDSIRSQLATSVRQTLQRSNELPDGQRAV